MATLEKLIGEDIDSGKTPVLLVAYAGKYMMILQTPSTSNYIIPKEIVDLNVLHCWSRIC